MPAQDKIKAKYEVLRYITFYTDSYPFDIRSALEFESLIGSYFPYCFEKVCTKEFKNIGILDTAREYIAQAFATGSTSDNIYKLEFSVAVKREPSETEKVVLFDALMQTVSAIIQALDISKIDYNDTIGCNWIYYFDKQIKKQNSSK